jgi:hypothetical protein
MLHEFGVINGCSSVSHFDIAKAGMGLEGQEEAARAILVIFIVVTLHLSWRHRDDPPNVLYQKAWTFIKAYQWTAGIIRLLVLRKHLLHMPKIATGDFADTPLLG